MNSPFAICSSILHPYRGTLSRLPLTLLLQATPGLFRGPRRVDCPHSAVVFVVRLLDSKICRNVQRIGEVEQSRRCAVALQSAQAIQFWLRDSVRGTRIGGTCVETHERCVSSILCATVGSNMLAKETTVNGRLQFPFFLCLPSEELPAFVVLVDFFPPLQYDLPVIHEILATKPSLPPTNPTSTRAPVSALVARAAYLPRQPVL